MDDPALAAADHVHARCGLVARCVRRPAFVAARPDIVPLVVCAELCSLHFQYGSRGDAVVANSIFADGAAAVVGGHPERPRVLGVVAAALGLPEEALADSRAVLAAHGNMSSATILFILERMLGSAAAGPCVAMAFGPGLTAELALLHRL